MQAVVLPQAIARMSKVRVSDLISIFSGVGDFNEWIRKVELVAKLQEVEDLQNFVPLFLSGGAFSVYESLSDADKKDYALLKAAMGRAFSLNCFAAFELLVSRRCEPGESVDVFLSDVRRLAALVQPNPGDAWIRCAFIRGLPETVRTRLQALNQINEMPISDVVEKARAIMSIESVEFISAAARVETAGKARRQPVCFSCNKPGHIARHCRAAVRRSSRSGAACFRCGATDHFISQCPEPELQHSKNE